MAKVTIKREIELGLGMIFQGGYKDSYYVVCSTAEGYALVNILTGGHWGDSVPSLEKLAEYIEEPSGEFVYRGTIKEIVTTE